MTGQIRTTSHIEAGNGTGGVALTVNDGYGNANVTWNHVGGVPDVSGNAARIEVNSDATTNAKMMFELGSGVTSGVATGLNSIMTLQADGNVGIGTTSPNQQLHVEGGDVRINSGNNGSLRFGANNQYLFGDGSSALYFNSENSSTSQMIFRDAENQVYGRVNGSGDGENFGLIDGDGDWGIRMIKDSATLFSINGDEKMRIRSDGRIGIGTTSPNGDIGVSAVSPVMSLENTASSAGSGGVVRFGHDQDGSRSPIGEIRSELSNGSAAGRSGNLSFWTSNGGSLSEKMAIMANGNVGIGTTNPNSKLHVAGTTRLAGTTNIDGIVNVSASMDQLRFTAGTDDWWWMSKTVGDNKAFGVYSPGSDGGSQSGFNFVVEEDGDVSTTGSMTATNFVGNGAGLTGISASDITSGTLNLDRIANNSIPASKIAANSVGSSELANNAVGAGQIAANAVNVSEIAANAVRASEIQDGSIVATTELSASGTKNASTFLRGDNVWATVTPTGAVLDNVPGNWEVVSNSNSSSYGSAALEVRELNNGGAQSGATAQAPRIAFHWGSRVASQIGMGTDGVIRTFDNPGTGYEDFAAEDINANGTVYRGDGKSIIQYSDAWLRLNPSNQFTNGIYAGALPLRTDGELQVGSGGSSFIVKSGNVGIGVANPQHSLHASGNLRIDGRNIYFGPGNQRIYGDGSSALYNDGEHSTVVQQIFRDKEDTIYGRVYGGSNGAQFGLMDGDGQWGMLMQKDAETRFFINNDEKMRIESNGNVGIGFNAPASVLHLADNNPEITFTNTAESTGTNATIGMFDDGLALSSQDPLSTYADIYIGQNRRVGIGTTSPAEDFEVNGDILADVFMQVARGSGSIAMTANDGGGNANIAFNHRALTPDQNGNAARINTNVDASTNANMEFQLKSGVTAGTSVGLETVMELREGGGSTGPKVL